MLRSRARRSGEGGSGGEVSLEEEEEEGEDGDVVGISFEVGGEQEHNDNGEEGG